MKTLTLNGFNAYLKAIKNGKLDGNKHNITLNINSFNDFSQLLSKLEDILTHELVRQYEFIAMYKVMYQHDSLLSSNPTKIKIENFLKHYVPLLPNYFLKEFFQIDELNFINFADEAGYAVSNHLSNLIKDLVYANTANVIMKEFYL